MGKLTCSDKELREIAIDWCELVNHDPTNEAIIDAFMMGAKLSMEHNGWKYLDKIKNK